MKTISINLYQFSELSEVAKSKAISKLSDINTNFNWWEGVYEDAKETANLEIMGFDLDRARECKGRFIYSAEDTAKRIIDNHGPDTDTFKEAKSFIEDIESIAANNPESDDNKIFGNYDTRECYLEAAGDMFLYRLLELYLVMLKEELNYRETEAAIIESIEANEYDFTEAGQLFTGKAA